MPLFLDMVGFMAEAYKHITLISGGDAWGDNLTTWILSALVSFKLPKDINIAVLCQFWTLKNYLDGEDDSSSGTHHFYRKIDNDNPLDFHFYRVGIAVKFKLR